jgi:transposase-like protein
MNDYAKTLLIKELDKKRNAIVDCEWWLRSVEALLNDDKKLENKSESDIEAYKQRLRSFKEAKERIEAEAKDLRAALIKLRS